MAKSNSVNLKLKPALPRLTSDLSFSDIIERATGMTSMAKDLRDKILAPKPRKAAPTFTSSQVAELCSIDRGRVNYLATKEGSGVPTGVLKGRLREFTLAETQEWIEKESGIPPRPENIPGKICLVGNFKGGSTKTSTAMCLAQGLSLRGRKVLLVDLDPQGSLTELCGFYADMEIGENDTLLPYLHSYMEEGEPMVDVSYAVKETYWNNINLVPASTALFGAEFDFPGIMEARPDVPIWSLLRRGLDPLKKDFDYIICDTPPSLSYMTVNAMMAADSILMPLVPDSLDFISSIQFWKLFTDVAKTFQDKEPNKRYDFVSILLSKVDSYSQATPIVRSWAELAYSDWMLKIEIPMSNAASLGALSFNTIYDNVRGSEDASRKTIDRIRQPFNELCRLIDETYIAKWEESAKLETKLGAGNV